MTDDAFANVIPFPRRSGHAIRCCPQCGTQTDFWRFGRLLWGFCDEHEVRWVAADLGAPQPLGADRGRLRRYLETLAAFDEVGGA